MQNTGDRWGELLGVLSEEELRQYGRVALDQVALVDRWFRVQIGALAVGICLALWGLWSGLKTNLGFGTLYWIAPVLAAVYWLYRSKKARQLWSVHFAAVNGELARRGDVVMETGPNLR